MALKKAMEVAEQSGNEREKAHVMCLEAGSSKAPHTWRQADVHFTNGNANKALVLVNKAGSTGVKCPTVHILPRELCFRRLG